MKKSIASYIFSSLLEVSCQNSHALQKNTVCIDSISIANEWAFITSAWNIKLTNLIYTVKSVETSTVEKKEQSCVFNRISRFTVITVTNMQIVFFFSIFIFDPIIIFLDRSK